MWVGEDIEAALAWQAEQACKCQGCGLPTDETTATDASYLADPVRCQACKARDRMAKQLRDDEADMSGIHWTIRPSAPLDDD